MKRSLVLLVTLALFLSACTTVAQPTKSGVITAVSETSITVDSQTYTIDRNTNIYAPDGNMLRRSFLANGQRVMVWASGEKAVRINVES